MRKRVFFTLLLLTSVILNISGQGIVIHLKDGTTTIIPTKNVESITMLSADEGYIIGKWHLGFWKAGSAVIHFDGTEYMLFEGKKLLWAGRGDGSDEYTIDYADDNKSFVATNIKNSNKDYWEIIKYTDNLLVLRNGGADRYFYTSQDAAQNAQMELDPPAHQETSDINTILTYAYGFTKSSSNPMGQHYDGRQAATDSDKQWLMDASNEPSTVAGLSRWIEKDVTLYPFSEPVPADINQHAIGDCSAMAVFASLAYLYPDFIKSIITDNGNKTYTVKMYDPQGIPITVCVSNKILCDANGTIGQATGKNNAITWATILEKAFMKWESRFHVDGVEGIGTEFLAPLFTGDGESYAFAPNTLHTSEHKTYIEWALNQGMITIGGFTVGGLKCGELETVTAHAFTYMLANSSDAIFAMRNPWGITSLDGVLQIPNDRTIVQTIDVRAVKPGAAAPYLRKSITPYNPPAFTPKKSDIGVSPRLIERAKMVVTNTNELW